MIVMFVAATFVLVVGSLEVTWRLYTRRDPAAMERMRFPNPVQPGEERTRFVVLVPALNEEAVIRRTAALHAQQDHALTQTIVSLQDHDKATHNEVAPIVRDYPEKIQVVSQTYVGKTMKADQLNHALACLDLLGDDFVGIGDAETLFPPTLLRHVEAVIRNTEADIVQAAVMLTNFGRKLREWWQVHCCMEYFGWFSSRMHFQAAHGYMPLGGNSVFVRYRVLRSAGNYPRHRTEDCKLGTDLAVMGVRTAAAYSPELCTREHTPPKVWGGGGWFGQRVRWDRGFLEVLLEGNWRSLPTVKQRFLAAFFLTTPFLQAVNALLLTLALATTFLIKVPVPLVLYTYLPYLPIILAMVLQLVGLREFARDFKLEARPWHYISLVLGGLPYQMMLMLAAVKAIWQYARHKDVGWGSKTERIAAVHDEGVFELATASLEAS